MNDPAPDHGSGELGGAVLLHERPATPSGVSACSERLPRDVLVRLMALSREVGDIRQEHAGHVELSHRLDDVVTGLAAVIQSIYDDTVQHLAGRRG